MRNGLFVAYAACVIVMWCACIIIKSSNTDQLMIRVLNLVRNLTLLLICRHYAKCSINCGNWYNMFLMSCACLDIGAHISI